MKVIYLILDAISYQDSWLKEGSKMKCLKTFTKDSLNFHNHYAVAHNTIGNVGSLLSGLSPSLTGVMGRDQGFDKNEYGYIQSRLNDIGCSTHFITPTRFFFSPNPNYKLDFNTFSSLSPSMADYRICAEELNNQHYFKKISELSSIKNYFLGMHYIDCHEPYETPINNQLIKKFSFPNIRKFLFTYENIFYRIPRRFLRLYLKPETILQNIYTYKMYPHLKKLKPKAFGPLLSPEKYRDFYKKCWEDENLYQEFVQMKLLATEYLDAQIANLLNYVKEKFSKDTVIFISPDHGNFGVLTPNFIKENGHLNELMTHIPLSIITFDEELKKKFKIEGNIKTFSSHTDFYNTALRLYNVPVKENEFDKDLFNMSSQDRFVMAETNIPRKNVGQTKLISNTRVIDLRIKPKENPKDWQLYQKEDLLNNPSDEEFSIYQAYKRKYNDFFESRKK